MSQEPITTYCPACGKVFRVPPELNGKKILCKNCQTYFMVQADKPGIPAAAPPAVPAAPVTAAREAPPTAPVPVVAPVQAATAPALIKVPTAPSTSPPITAATAAPAAAPPPAADELAPIPFDDSPAAVATDGGEAASAPTVGKPKTMEKVKIESKGPYFVVKLVTAGKMPHVNIENTLNEHAPEGWRLEQIITVGTEAYAILSRFSSPDKPA